MLILEKLDIFLNKSPDIIPKTAIVLFNNGAFGGAERRFSNLFLYLYSQYPDKFYYFINYHLLGQIKRIYPDFPLNNVRIIDFKKNSGESNQENNNTGGPPKKFQDITPDPLETDKSASFFRKLFWFQKNKSGMRLLHRQIEKFRSENNITVLMGVFSGVLPLVFYLNYVPKKASVIFSDMDSWFSDVHLDMKKLWYRKYYSFNYALENSDYIDLLSPFIKDGLKKRNVKIKEEKTYITECSFADYSKCIPGEKKNLEIAFSGRLEPDKNPMLYLQAAKEILKEHPDIKFYLMGEGSLVDEINNFIASNKMEKNVIFQFHSSPAEILAETSIFVSLQSGTNYPSQSVLEAMACGNAVIASDTGDTKLLINGTNGILTGLDIVSLVNALRTLIDDREKTLKLGQNGREFVLKNHTIEKASVYYTDLFIKAHNELTGGVN